MRGLEKLLVNDAILVLRLHVQVPIGEKVALVLSGGGTSCLDQGHLVLGPCVRGDSLS